MAVVDHLPLGQMCVSLSGRMGQGDGQLTGGARSEASQRRAGAHR